MPADSRPPRRPQIRQEFRHIALVFSRPRKTSDTMHLPRARTHALDVPMMQIETTVFTSLARSERPLKSMGSGPSP